jgi:hypothetical protein
LYAFLMFSVRAAFSDGNSTATFSELIEASQVSYSTNLT